MPPVSPSPHLFGSGPAVAGGLLALAMQLLIGGSLTPGPAQAQDSRLLERYEKRLENWFHRIDRNGDGRLSPFESKGYPFLEMNFERLDSTGRGYLLPQDLAPANNHFLGERLRKSFQRADRDGNGQLSQAEAASFPWLAKRFSEMDRDRNGNVSLEEFWDFRRSLSPRP
ncbi:MULTISPECIES: EF-hand domain-containing protein [unclassified Synechococcus]|uniref:EF-hand domain-containing protein n=1 Tax=unclassified Synechococcus TaxID=2626047 RepID=UPI0021A2DC8D|nr:MULTISPECIES: EF-hand domain-containing protein [unclassified Synechococcus]MCT0212944.1 EF-hand domain-containing protein [Synechococcus sp. CS-1326]MCT0233148.1 EF-hand domain-containing protein [Synechococcus sp. CS-1327]